MTAPVPKIMDTTSYLGTWKRRIPSFRPYFFRSEPRTLEDIFSFYLSFTWRAWRIFMFLLNALIHYYSSNIKHLTQGLS
jgi:hypothetical protein